MFAPCSANVRATSSSSRGRSQESTAICTRKLCEAPPSQLTGVKRSGWRASALTFGQSNENVVDAVDVDAVVLAADGVLRARSLERDGFLLGDLLRLQTLQYLVDDL